MANKELQYQEDEIDLRQLMCILLASKKLIVVTTVIITLLAGIYAFTKTPIYEASISFTSPSQNSVLQLNKIKMTSETRETIYRQFLQKISSKQFQRKVFNDNNYLVKINPESKQADNPDNDIRGFINSIQMETNKNDSTNYEQPIEIKMTGSNAVIISSFLNDLTKATDESTINDLLSIIQQKIDIRLTEIAKQRSALLSQAKQDRLSQIKRIEETDQQKISEIQDEIERLRIKARDDRLNEIFRIKEANNQRIQEINGQIPRLRVKAKKDRENKITSLGDAVNIASSLGITHNNFNKFISEPEYQASLMVTINENMLLPSWYLYGSEALLEEIEVLQNRTNDDSFIAEIVTLQNEIIAINNDERLRTLVKRTNDDPFIAEIVTLQNALKEIESNQALKTLKSRNDDSPFIAEINILNAEVATLKSYALNSAGINAMQINQHSYPPESPIAPKKRLIVSVAFIAGLMLSIFLVFLLNAFKRPEDEKAAA